MSQGTLFASSTPRSPPSKYSISLERYQVKEPYGRPDAKGNLFYEKFWKALEKMPKDDQEVISYIVTMRPSKSLEHYEKFYRLYRQATNFDLLDFDESRGRL
jgi:sulfatase maturation enzyme AslB (radical SAM superfamily)